MISTIVIRYMFTNPTSANSVTILINGRFRNVYLEIATGSGYNTWLSCFLGRYHEEFEPVLITYGYRSRILDLVLVRAKSFPNIRPKVIKAE